MSILDDGSIAAIVHGAANALLMEDVTLHKRSPGQDEYANPNGVFANHTLRGLKSEFSDFRRHEMGLPDDDAKLLLLQHDAPAAPQSGDEITARGIRYLILSVKPDPAGAAWEVHGRLTSG